MNNPKIVLGIDPGVSGAIAVFHIDRGLIDAHDMPVFEIKVSGRKRKRPNIHELRDLVDAMRPGHAYVEEVHAMPQQGVSSTFSFGHTFGAIEGVLAGLGVPYSLVAPQEWRKRAGLVSGQTKDASRRRAAQVMPYRADLFKRVKDDGRAEAALIAWAMHKQA